MTEVPDNVDLAWIGRRLMTMGHDIVALRDAVDVLTAMAIRHENSIQTVVHELRALHRQGARFSDRLRRLEGAIDE